MSGTRALDDRPAPEPARGVLARISGATGGHGRELLALAVVLVVAAALRLPDLATRGPWDADQGEQMLVIRAMVNGELPLLGPPTSTGGLHHGPAFYYYAALFAWPSGGTDPTAVTLGIALGGIATVALVWWLVRAAGGGVIGAAVAALLVAVSAHMIDASVRLWNPALLAPAAALAVAAALEARRSSNPRWWLLAALGFGVAVQSHVLAWVLAAPVGILAADELRRSGRRAIPWLAGAAGIVVLSFAPLVAHELTTEFGEVRAVLEARGAAPTEEGTPWIVRILFVPLRVLSVPLVRDVLAAIAWTTLAAALVVGAAGVASLRGSRVSGPARMLGVGLAIGIALLVVGADWLATVTPLYVDHYHLVLDPVVFALLGLGAAVLVRRRPGQVVVAVAVAGIAAWNLLVVPLPPVYADGGWPAGLAAGERVVAGTAGEPAAIAGSPKFKKTTAVDYPITILGQPPVAAADATRAIVLCEDLFEEVVGLACRGPAETARLTELGIPEGALLDRFEAAPGRWISVYRIAGR